MEKTEYINHSIKKIRTPRKSIGVAIFWGLGLLLAAVLVRHHNPLADQVTEQMKKVSGCVLIAFTCIIFTIFYERILTIPAELFQSRGTHSHVQAGDGSQRSGSQCFLR